MIRRPPRSTPLYSSAASDVYKRQTMNPTALIGTSNEAVGKIIHLAPDKPKLLLILPNSLLNDAILQLELAPSW